MTETKMHQRLRMIESPQQQDWDYFTMMTWLSRINLRRPVDHDEARKAFERLVLWDNERHSR